MAIVRIIKDPNLWAPPSISPNPSQRLEHANVVQGPGLSLDPGGKHCFIELWWELCSISMSGSPLPLFVYKAEPFIYSFGESFGASLLLNTEMMNSVSVVKSYGSHSGHKNKKILITQRFCKAEEELEG